MAPAKSWGLQPNPRSANADQLEDNLGSVDFELGSEHMTRLNEVSVIELGFPHDMIQSDRVRKMLSGGVEVTA